MYMWVVMMKAGLCVHVGGDDEGWSVCTCG